MFSKIEEIKAEIRRHNEEQVCRMSLINASCKCDIFDMKESMAEKGIKGNQ